MTKRLFIALDIPEKILDAIFNQIKFCDENCSIKWEKKNKIHLTLKFLGDVKEELISQLIENLQKNVKNNFLPKLKLSKFGSFKKGVYHRVLWADFFYNESLNKLYEKINLDLSKLGFAEEERKFKPHLTLARLKGNENQKDVNNFLSLQLEQVSFVIDSISVYESELKKSGAEYTNLKKIYFRSNK